METCIPLFFECMSVCVYVRDYSSGAAVSNRWTGLLEWTTGMDFDLFSSFFSRAAIYIEELV